MHSNFPYPFVTFPCGLLDKSHRYNSILTFTSIGSKQKYSGSLLITGINTQAQAFILKFGFQIAQ